MYACKYRVDTELASRTKFSSKHCCSPTFGMRRDVIAVTRVSQFAYQLLKPFSECKNSKFIPLLTDV